LYNIFHINKNGLFLGKLWLDEVSRIFIQQPSSGILKELVIF
jgi:hypothetical protein